MIVHDASVLIEVLLRTKIGAAIGRRMFARGETLHVPQLIDIETTQVLHRHVAKGAIAQALDAPLLTCDRRLAAAAGHRARIEPM
jgi:predicted nucleic acid-binding protein